MGGQFVLSDDAHGVPQLGHSYEAALTFLDNCKVSQLSFFDHHDETKDDRFPSIGTRRVDLKDVMQLLARTNNR